MVRADRPGQVELGGCNVVPDPFQRLQHGRFAGFGVHVRCARPQVSRGHRVPDGGGLLTQRHPVLVQVAIEAGIGRRAAVAHEHTRQLQVAALAGDPVQVHQADDLRRVEPEVGQRGRRRRQEHAAQVVCQLDRDRQQIALAGRLHVHGGGGEAVAGVIQLVVVYVLPAPLGRVEGYLGVEVAVILLRGGDPADHLVHLPVQVRIARYTVDVSHRLQPLVAVAVAPVGALVGALLQAGGDAEVGQPPLVGRILQSDAHARQNRSVAEFETIGPEPAGPAALAKRRRGHPAVWTRIVVSGTHHR